MAFLNAHKIRNVSFPLLALLLIPLLHGICDGAGFAILQQGTAPMGQGNAFVAQADDPSAIFFNPAGITQLKGTQGYLGTTVIVPRITYEGKEGQEEATVTKVYAPSHVYITHQVSRRLYAGLGIFSPFGLATAWKGDWEGRYLSTYSSLQTLDVNPNLSLKLGRFSVAAGVNVLGASLKLRKRILLYPLPDGSQELTDTAWGYGYNLGTLYEISDWCRLGISYRSRIHLNFDDADANFNVPPALKDYFKDTHAKGKLNLPPSLTMGISISPIHRLAVEFDVTWTGWSTYDEMKIRLDNPVGPPGHAAKVFRQPKRWRDVFAYRLGLKYILTPNATVRFGYIFDQSPVPGKTIDPQLPDGNRMIFAAGFNYKIRPDMVLGVAYNYIDGIKRVKDNDIMENLPEIYRVNGDYDQNIHSLGISLAYRF